MKNWKTSNAMFGGVFRMNDKNSIRTDYVNYWFRMAIGMEKNKTMIENMAICQINELVKNDQYIDISFFMIQ
jgi:hypothetical protein